MDNKDRVEEVLRYYRLALADLPGDLPIEKYKVAMGILESEFADQILEIFS